MKSARFGCLLLAWVLLTGNPFAIGTEPAPAPEAADLDTQVGPLILRDESVDQVLALLERWTGKTMLRPQALPATAISLSLRGSVPRDEAIRALETLLILNGIALTPLGEQFIKVTALTAAKSEAPELIEGTTLTRPASGRMASKIFQLTFLRVADFMPQITGLLNPAAASPPVIFEKTNAALITDSISNLQRIETLLRQMDQPVMEGLNPEFYPLRYAKANDVVNRMRAILGGPLQTQIGSAVSYNADERSNQVIVVSDPRQHPFFGKLIQRLDVKSSQDMKHEVIYLMHAAAKDMAAILSQLVAGQNSAAKSSGLPGPRPAPIDPATAAGPAAPAPAPAVVAALTGNAGFEASNQFSSSITILPEERSNSLIVSGTADDIRLISDIIAKFDILLAQVRIEVVIAEVSLGDNATSGISALGLTVAGDKLTGFRGAGAGINVTDGLITRPGVAGTGPLDLAALISLATTPRKSIATILSVPTIITSHSKEGRIFVGEQRPVISSYLNDGATAGGGTLGVGYRSTVSSKDIGIQLSVKPLIGADGAVELEIKQEVNDILGDITIDGNPQPRIGRRTTESFVSVRSGEIIVLGGLQRGSESRSTSRLGPLPLIGDLLGSRSREKTRTDLVFFLRPTVLSNTPKDNLEALNQIRQFPAEPREELARILSDR